MGIAADAAGNLYVTGAGKLSKVHFVSNVFSYIADIPMTSTGTQGLYEVGWGAVATDAANDAWFSQWITYSPTNTSGYLYEYQITGAPTRGSAPARPAGPQPGRQRLQRRLLEYLYNGGNNDAHITATTFGGSGAAFFHLTSNGCLGHALAPGQSCPGQRGLQPWRHPGLRGDPDVHDDQPIRRCDPIDRAEPRRDGRHAGADVPVPDPRHGVRSVLRGSCSSSNLIANGPNSIVFAEPNINRVGMFTTVAF